jgi:hypothetical protein
MVCSRRLQILIIFVGAFSFYLSNSLITLIDSENRPEAGIDCSNSDIPCSEASISNQIQYFIDFYSEIHLGKPQMQYFWFVGLDSSWRRQQDVSKDSVEGHFGIFHDNGIIKEQFQSLSFSCPLNSEIIFTMPEIVYE